MKLRSANCPLTIFSSHRTVLVLVCGLCMALCAVSGIAQAQNPVPLINQPLVPDTVAPGGSGFTLTVNGTGFVSGSVVNWNGSSLATTFISTSQVTASVPAADIATANTASVTVVSPGAGKGTSNTVFFPVALPAFITLTESDYGVGAAPPAVSTADLNGDGKLDLVLTNSSDNTISVLQGNGDGTFQTQVTYAVGENPRDIAIADFKGNGRLDAAVTNTNSNTVSVLLGNGDGTFQPQVQYATGTGAYGIAAADVNGDGKLDLLVTNSGTDTISVLLGNGDGTFQAAANYGVGKDPRSIAVGDFNRDGKLDLAVANFDTNTVTVLLGNGDGTFSTPASYSTGSGTRFLATADFNGDGKLDLAVANQFDDTISILLGNGDGTFQTPVNYATGIFPTWVGAGDINGDGKLDLAVADYNSTGDVTASLLLGNGDGTFQTHMDYNGGQPGDQLAIGDFNGDGKLDLAAADQHSTTVSVLLQHGFASGPNATFSPTSLTFPTQLLNTTSPPESVTLINYGTEALIIKSDSVHGDFAQTGNCGKRLAPGASCTSNITFTPKIRGNLSGKLSIADNAPGSPQTVSLMGAGTVVELNPSSLGFAVRSGQRQQKQTTLTNVGSSALSISSIVITGSDTFSQTNTCGTSVGAGGSCTITVTLNCGRFFGSFTGDVSISDNGGASPQEVALTGMCSK